MDVKDIMILILLVLLVGVSVWLIISSILSRNKTLALMAKLEKIKEDMDKLELSNEFKVTEYSDSVLEFIRKFCMEVSVQKFRTFMDGHKADLITKSILEGLIKEICEFITIHLNYDIIVYGYCLYTKSYIDEYIIETVVMSIKDLFDKAVVDITE